MSTPTDPADLVRTFLNAVEPYMNQLPDPFGEALTSSGLSGDRAPPVRLLGHLARLAEVNRELGRHFIRQRSDAIQGFISRGSANTTVSDSRMRALYSEEEADRSRAWDRWYSGLSATEQAALDDYCLAIAEPTLRPFLPQSLPACLHGPLARLALEYAAVVRRATTERQQRAKSLAERGTNPTVVDSILQGFSNVEEEAKSRLVGQWLLELTPVQAAAFDKTRPVRVAPPAKPIKTPKRPAKRPTIPPVYKKPMNLLPKFQAIKRKDGKRWRVADFCSWLRTEHHLVVAADEFSKWYASHMRSKRRAAGER